jgi:hypothetical protein
MTPVLAEAVRNIKNAMEGTFEKNKDVLYNLLIGGKNGRTGFKDL